MTIFLFTLLILNVFLSYSFYRYLYRRRNVFSERFEFVMAITASSIISLVLALNMFLLFPNSLSLVGGYNIVLGIGVGYIFGAMVNTHSRIAGLYNGGIGGVMGTMIGAVAYDPSLCGLPFTPNLQDSIVLFFGLFSFFLLALSIGLIRFSLRV